MIAYKTIFLKTFKCFQNSVEFWTCLETLALVYNVITNINNRHDFLLWFCLAHCVEGMELNNDTMLCEPCQIGFYKNVSANDSMFDINERFWCLPCPDGLTTYDFRTVHNYECIGMNIFFNENQTFPINLQILNKKAEFFKIGWLIVSQSPHWFCR